MNTYPEAGYTPANLRHYMAQQQMSVDDVAEKMRVKSDAVTRWLTDPKHRRHRSMSHQAWQELTAAP